MKDFESRAQKSIRELENHNFNESEVAAFKTRMNKDSRSMAKIGHLTFSKGNVSIAWLGRTLKVDTK